jgi:hypothetical protein
MKEIWIQSVNATLGANYCTLRPRQIARELQNKFDIPDERVVEFNPSLRDPVDIMGLPFRAEDGSHAEWLPPAEFYAIRAGQGPAVLILEELSDASMAMQNPLCRVILDRYAGQLKLSEQLFIIATGNRVEDKSGANRLSTKLGNRTRQLDFQFDVEDWCQWAASKGISPMLTSFIKFRPNLLCDFDAKRTVNPTPRSWEDVSRVPEDLSPLAFFEHIKGAVGEGAAAEYTSFLKTAQTMPDVDGFLDGSVKVDFDKLDASVKYAFCGAIESKTTPKTFSNVFKRCESFTPEFLSMIVIGAYRRDSNIAKNKEFTKWAMKMGHILNSK